MAANNRIKLIFLLMACLVLLNSCALINVQIYKPAAYIPVDHRGQPKIIISDKVMLTASVDCDEYQLGNPIYFSDDPRHCRVTAGLFGDSSLAFEFVNEKLVIKDAKHPKTKYIRLNTIISEFGPKQFPHYFDNLEGNYNYYRAVATGFLLKKRPKYLELIIPDISINGKMYRPPIIGFEYSQKVEFRYISP